LITSAPVIPILQANQRFIRHVEIDLSLAHRLKFQAGEQEK
jgi:hypothetical protein